MKKTLLGGALILTGALAVAVPLSLPSGSPATAAVPASVLPSFAPLVEITRPAVVTVRTAGRTGSAASGGQGQIDPQMREFMERFFGPDFQVPNQPRSPGGARPSGIGSGFIIEANGVIVTNNHVIDDADEITVVLSDGTELSATLIGADPKTDLAVLRVEAGRSLPTVPWGNSDAVQVGDWAIAIGNPFGFGGTVTAGIVSARGRDIRSGPYDDFLQVDASINRGNSGGPLFDQQGNVIGVNTAIFSPSGGNVGIGFAIPANQAREIVDDLIQNGEVERGWLGVSIQQVTPAIAESLGLSDARGALISELTEGGPAARDGLNRGDIIVGFGGTEVDTLRDLTRAVADTAPGTRTDVRILRRGSERTVTVRTGQFPS
ncbi:MAG: Do family serine endopeptidase [Pseudomonadota bacterium]